MNNLQFARAQMAFSLGWHMVFAAIGVGMPFFMLIAEGLYLRTRQQRYLALARTWAKATGVLFAIGAVSGTALSFELGLLWPPFMRFAGTAVGPAFTLEGFAFFLEAIFLGLYLYGWKRLSPVAHWWCGVPVALSGAASSVLVVAADAWMQNPVGAATLANNPSAFDPAVVFQNPFWGIMAVHSTLSAYTATAFAVVGVYAWGMLRGRTDPLRRSALTIAVVVATVFALLMPVTGDRHAKFTAVHQPAKLAALEGQFTTEQRAPLRIGGWPDPATGTVRYAIEVPGGLSILAFGDFNAVVTGLDRVPRADWPNVRVVHIAFQLMVAAAMAMLGVVLWWWLGWRRHRGMAGRLLLIALVLCSPLGFLALESGWVVTEVGRQPWILYGVMRTASAVTTSPHVAGTFWLFVLVYFLLTVTLLWLLSRLKHTEEVG